MQGVSLNYLLLGLFITFGIRGNSQENCTKNSPLWRDYKYFIPTDDSPVYTVKINFVIPQRSDGTGNFQEDDPEHMLLLRESVDRTNKLWSDLKKPKDPDCYGHDDFLSDSHIRFKLNAIIFIQDDFYWNGDNGSGCPNDGDWFINPLEKEIRSNPSYDNAINVYLTNLPVPYEEVVLNKSSTGEPKAKSPCSELPTNSILDRSSRINMSGSYNKFWWMKNVVPNSTAYNSDLLTWEDAITYWMRDSFSHTLAHELGHSMGLNHANEHHGRNKCDESIMNQGHGKPHNYLQPTELGKIQRNLRMSNIRNFLEEDVFSEVPFEVVETLEIDMSYAAYEDIIVRDGATLTISCELDMHPRARIIAEPGAKILIQDAIVHHRNAADRSGGIELQRERAFFWKSCSKRRQAELQFEGTGRYIGTIKVKKVRKKKKKKD